MPPKKTPAKKGKGKQDAKSDMTLRSQTPAKAPKSPIKSTPAAPKSPVKKKLDMDEPDLTDALVLGYLKKLKLAELAKSFSENRTIPRLPARTPTLPTIVKQFLSTKAQTETSSPRKTSTSVQATSDGPKTSALKNQPKKESSSSDDEDSSDEDDTANKKRVLVKKKTKESSDSSDDSSDEDGGMYNKTGVINDPLG